METLILWLCENSEHAVFYVFGLLVIAGFSLPISEDLLVLASGVVAATVLPEKSLQLFMAAFFGSLIADSIAYGLGRFFGDKIYNLKWFKRGKISAFYEKYGIWTLVIGRCIPFGLRNGIFMSAGVAKMNFALFLLSDALACLAFSAALFSLAYTCGSNSEHLYHYVQQGGLIVLAIFLATVICLVAFRRKALKTS